MNITPFPTLSPATIDAINVIGQWLAQDDFSGEVPYQADCVILAGNAVMPTIDAACKIARDQQIPLLISGGIGVQYQQTSERAGGYDHGAGAF